MIKKSFALLLFLVVFLAAFTGCAQVKQEVPAENNADSSKQASPPEKNYATASELYADLAKLSPAEVDQKLLEGAKKEGVIRLYTTLDEQIIEQIKKEFEKVYPGIKVEYLSGKETDLNSRALTEFRSGRYLVDILQTAADIQRINQEFPFAKHYKLPLLEYHPKAFYTDYWFSISFDGVAITYNTKLLPANEAPRSYDDLLDPKWKGKVAIDIDPNQMISALVATRGEEKARKYMNKLLLDNDAQVRKGHTNIVGMLIAGEFPVAAELFTYSVETKITQGAPLEWIAQDPMPVRLSPLALVDKAPHPYASMLFAKFYGTSEAASKIISQEGRTPVHPKVEAELPRLKQRLSEPKVQNTFFSLSPENRSLYAKTVDSIIRELVESKLKS